MNVYATLFYTSKDKDYQKNLYSFLNNYKKIGIKDVFLYTDECLPDEFEWLYKDFFQKHRRGYGYWAWKPLIIYDSMKKVNDGDFILYHDVGRSCYNFDINYEIHPLVKDIKENYAGIGVAKGPFKHKEFCKRDAFYYMGCDEKACWDLNQLSATWSFWEKAELPKKILMDWLKWCFHEKEIITDLPNKCGLPNLPEFKDNRHDQTILTNLIYLYGKNNPKIKPLEPIGWEKPMDNCLKKYYHVDPDSVLFVIKSCEKYESRIDAIRSTWLKDNDNYIVFSDHENESKKIIKVTDKKEYVELEDKTIAIFNYLKSNKILRNKYRWIFFCDDDTYVNLNSLRQIIKENNKSIKQAFGFVWDCFKDKENYLCNTLDFDKSTRWFDGGAGILFSSKDLDNLNIQKHNTPFDDLSLSLNFKNSGINLIHDKRFHFHAGIDNKSLFNEKNKLSEQISFHAKNKKADILNLMNKIKDAVEIKKPSLVIGFFQNYNFDKLKPWINSLNSCGFKGDKVLIGADISDDLVNKINNSGVKCFRVTNLHRKPNIQRFKHIENFLNYFGSNYEYVITTDVADVIFQKNPEEWIKNNIKDKKIIASGEAIKFKHEWWNRMALERIYNMDIVEEFDDYEALNCGVLAGKVDSILSISKEIYDSTINLDHKFDIPDQPAYNFIIRKDLSKDTLFTSLDDGWSTNLNVIKSDLVTPNIKEHLLNKEPFIDSDNIIRNSKNEIIYIIHQYNRSQELNKIILEKYGN
jgi:hypothetical protein